MQYMSPERLNGNGAGYSWPADVWSAGLIMLECAMGQHPYQAMGEAVSFFFF
jgi:mitogen-activated protein kinase kinase 9